MVQYKTKDSTINLIIGDIAEQTTEAIVNAANNHLWMDGGVAGAIKRKGGEIIEQEAMLKGPIEVGKAIVTTAGKLQSKYVIHASVMGQDLNTDDYKIQLAAQNCLKRAEELKVNSIAFQALGAGVGGFPKEKCAQIMIDEIINHTNKNSIIKRSDFVLFDRLTYAVFEQELNTVMKNRTE
jgi:O-acetyl-ADP-ribose deacetylase (regulator of RNase III)